MTLIILLISLPACRDQKKIIIRGEITGEIPEKLEYTVPVHGVCNYGFKDFVQPDSLGKFKIEIETEEEVFIKLMINNVQGTLISEPGKSYNVRLDLNNKETPFSVSGKYSSVQEAYNKLPSPVHIQIGAGEFLRDTLAAKIKTTIDQRRTDEIAVFEKFLADKMISPGVFELIKNDRNAYYDAILSTIAWIKDLMVIQGAVKSFPDDFRNLWIETFDQSLISNPVLVKSPWFNFYAETYIYFKDYMNGNFTKEKIDSVMESGQMKAYRVSKAKEYLPPEIQEYFIADYLYQECIQKQYEKELFSFIEQKYPEVMRTVREKKEITDEVKTALSTILNEFKNTFKPIKAL